jgi:hypothetical protein
MRGIEIKKRGLNAADFTATPMMLFVNLNLLK